MLPTPTVPLPVPALAADPTDPLTAWPDMREWVAGMNEVRRARTATTRAHMTCIASVQTALRGLAVAAKAAGATPDSLAAAVASPAGYRFWDAVRLALCTLGTHDWVCSLCGGPMHACEYHFNVAYFLEGVLPVHTPLACLGLVLAAAGRVPLDALKPDRAATLDVDVPLLPADAAVVAGLLIAGSWDAVRRDYRHPSVVVPL
jgi:hypothetical protein